MGYLAKALDFRASELLSIDLLAAVGGGVGGALLGIHHPQLVASGLGTLSGLVGVIIGAVLAGAAIQAAFMDERFLAKVHRIGRDPVRYLAPFLFTAVLGVAAAVALTALAMTSVTAPGWWRGTITGLTGFLSLYTLVSLLPGLSTLVQFIGLKSLAAQVPDDAQTPHAQGR